MILAANDVADAQVGIIGAGGQMIGRHAVAAQQGEILDLVGQFALLAIDGVGEAQDAVVSARHAEAQGKRLTGGGAAVALGAGKFAHAGIEEPRTLVRGAPDFRSPRVRGGEVAIGEALREDRLGHLAVQGQALGLLVLFVPGETEPAQAVEDGGDAASELRSTSVSSRRSTMVPPLWRA